MRDARNLKGQVAFITGGGSETGRAIALALSARGVSLIVTGPEERPVGETVGEIAYQGGKARHLVGEAGDAKFVEASLDRAFETFGGLDIVVACADAALGGVKTTFERAAARMKGPGRLIVTSGPSASGHEGLKAVYQGFARELAGRGITCNAVLRGEGYGDEAEPALLELVLLLCSAPGAAITGQVTTIG